MRVTSALYHVSSTDFAHIFSRCFDYLVNVVNVLALDRWVEKVGFCHKQNDHRLEQPLKFTLHPCLPWYNNIANIYLLQDGIW